MIFSLMQRKNLQETIEGVLPAMENSDHKNLFLVLLALLHDLDEKEKQVNKSHLRQQNTSRGITFVEELQQAIEKCQTNAVNEIDGSSIQKLTLLAEQMKRVSESLFILRDTLFEAQEGPLGKETLQ